MLSDTIPDQQVEWGGAVDIDLSLYFLDAQHQTYSLSQSAGLYSGSVNGTVLTLSIEDQVYPGFGRETVTITADGPGGVTQRSFDLIVQHCSGAIVYVDVDAVGLANGNDWADALTTFRDALNCALDGHELWVAEGTYQADRGEGALPVDTFRIVHDVGIYGGFDGTEALRTERNPDLHATVFSTVQAAGISNYGFVIQDGATVTMDGIALESSPSELSAGGIIVYQATATLSRIALTAGSGFLAFIRADDASLTLTDSAVSSSFPFADFYGSRGYPSYVYGLNGSTVRLERVDFRGLHCGGTRFACFKGAGGSDFTVVDSTFANLSVGLLSSLFDVTGSTTIERSHFYGIHATDNYAATLVVYGVSRVSDSIFVGIDTMLVVTPGGVVADVDNITVVGNANPKDQLFWTADAGTLTVSNSIILGYGAGLITGPATFSHCILEGAYNDSTAAWEFGGSDGGGNVDADNVDPALVDPDGVDNILGTPDDDVSLSSSSPAIDFGDNAATTSTTDAAGNPRIVDGDANPGAIIDIGAYEYQ